MANDGSVDVLIQQKAIDNIAIANKALEQSLKLILDINKASRGGSASGTSPADAEKVNAANRAATQRLKIADQTLVMQKKLLQSEINLSNARTKENAKIVQNRTEMSRRNKIVKDAFLLNSKLTGAYQKQSIRLTQLRKRYKDVAIAEGLASKNAIKLRKEVEKLDTKLKKVDKTAGQFQRNVGDYKKGMASLKNIMVGMVGAFGVIEALRFGVNFIKDIAAVTREAKGVDFAFKNLGDNAQKAFDDVRKSTRGLLSDLAIKKNIILFDNFNISLEQMGDLMQFAAVRSAQTGESMEHLAQSIATGLGRESVLILDNLGINTKELRNTMDELGVSMTEAFSILASREVAEAGNILEEATNSQEKFNAALENFKISAGGGWIADFSDNINRLGTEMLNFFSDINEISDSNWDLIKNFFTGATKAGEEFLRVEAQLSRSRKEEIRLRAELGTLIRTQAIKDGLAESQIKFKLWEIEKLRTGALKDRIAELKKSKETEDELNKIIKKTVDFYNNLISETKKLRDSTAETNKEYEEFTKTIEDAELALSKLEGTFREIQKVSSLPTGAVSEVIPISSGGIAPTEIETRRGVDPKAQAAAEEARIKKLFELQEEARNLTKDLEQEAAFALFDLGNTLFDRKLSLIDAEIQAEEDKYARLFELAEGNDNQQRLLAIEKEENLKELEKKRQKEEKKQAIFNKTIAIADIGIKLAQTIAAINLAAANLNAVSLGTAGTVFAAVQIPLAIGIAAAQTAAVLATPIPQFAKGGTMDHDGLAVVGDGGVNEVIKNPDGSIQVTPDTSTLVNLKKGAEIFPSIEDAPSDITDKIYSATVMASLSINNSQMKGYLETQKIFNDKLLDAMLDNTKAVKNSKSNVYVKSNKIDIPHEMFKSKYTS